jgi:hypothetical protein
MSSTREKEIAMTHRTRNFSRIASLALFFPATSHAIVPIQMDGPRLPLAFAFIIGILFWIFK